MSDLKKPKKPNRPPTPPAKPKLELVRINPTVPPAPASPPKPIGTAPRPKVEPKPPEPAPPPPKGLLPITPPTEPLQYRAIGLVEGRFVPEEAEPNKGTLVTTDGHAISSVILGKMISIVKRKLPPDRSYLWVVYPRTQTENGHLHLQITGVWAPVELGKSDHPIDPGFPDGYFSIRGEVVQIEPDRFVVKIKRTDPKAVQNRALRKFKLKIKGELPEQKVGYFWDLAVRRVGMDLYLMTGTAIEPIPKKPYVKKKSKPKKVSKTKLEEKPKRAFDRPRRQLKPDSSGGYKPTGETEPGSP
jgi:hypothetical protein